MNLCLCSLYLCLCSLYLCLCSLYPCPMHPFPFNLVLGTLFCEPLFNFLPPLFSVHSSLDRCSIFSAPLSLHPVPSLCNLVPYTISCYLHSCSFFCCTCSCTLFPALLLKMLVPDRLKKIFFNPLQVKLGRVICSSHLGPSTFDTLRLFLRTLFPHLLFPCSFMAPFTLHPCMIHSCYLHTCPCTLNFLCFIQPYFLHSSYLQPFFTIVPRSTFTCAPSPSFLVACTVYPCTMAPCTLAHTPLSLYLLLPSNTF
jgi:hypothetical protein